MAAVSAGQPLNGGPAEAAGVSDSRFLVRGRSAPGGYGIDVSKLGGYESAEESPRVSFEQSNTGSRRTSAVKGDAPLKKKSWMNWKPLRAIAQIGTSKSSCVFSLTLHYIENLPTTYNGRRVAVNWMRKENYVDSKPATVSDGFADFEEILHLKCTMYGGKGGTKYLPKSSTLSVQAVDGDRAVLGRHKLDLSRLLPSGDMTGRRGSGGGGLDGSTVSFPLSVGSLLVTFGYKVVDAPELNRTWTGTEMVAPRTGANRFAVSKSQKLLNYQPQSPKPPEAPVHPEPIVEAAPSPRKQTRDSGTSPEAAGAEAKERGTSPEAEEKDEEEVEKKVLGEEEKGEDAAGSGEVTEEEARAEKGGEAMDEGGEAMDEDAAEVAGDAPPHERTGSDVDEAEFLQLLGTKSDEFKEADDTEFDARSDVAQLSRPGSPRENLAGGFEQSDSQPPTPKTALLRQFEAEMGLFGEEKASGGGMFEDLVDDEGVAYDADEEYRHSPLGGGDVGADELGAKVQERIDLDKGGYRLVHRPRYVLDDNGQWVVAGYEEEYEPIDAEDGELYVEASNQDFGRTDYELMDDRPMTGEELWEAYRSQEGFHAALRRRNADMEVGPEAAAPSLSAEYLASQDAPPLKKTSKSRVEELEAAETELLMQQFGLTQDAFDDSPTPPQNPMQRHLSRVVSMQADAMSLAHASGNALAGPPATALNSGGPSVVALGDGGCLRAMDMRLFPKGSSGLVMQCSQPVVVPPEMGGNAVEIMQRMAGAGADGMIAGALASMPMAELTGMSIDQIAAEGMAALEGSHKKGWASLLDSGAAHRAVQYSSQSLEGGNSALHLEGRTAPLALEYEGSPQQTGQLVTAGRPGFAGYSSNFAELEADRKALAVFEGNLPESLSDEARALAIRDVKTELAMRRESRARRQARELAARNQGGLAGGDRPLAPGELPEQLVGLEELGPLAMQTVESLAIEGLKIQTDMTDQEAPYQVDALSWGDVDPKFIEHAKKQAQAGQLPMMGGPQQFQMLEGGEYISTSDGGGAMVPLGGPLGGLFSGRNADMEVNAEDYEANMALMASAVSLDEWMRLDTGVEQDEEGMSEQTRAILAAHRAQHGDVAAARAKPGGPQQGAMGDKLTLAMLVQLRDPLRNYEPVGQPMLAMVQAERVLAAAPPRRTKRQARLEAAKQRTLQLEGGQQRRAIMGPEEGGARTEDERRAEEEEERRMRQEAVDGAVQEEANVYYSDDDELEDAPPPPAETQPKFRITGVHMAGLGKNDKPDAAAAKHKKWGGQKQQVAGSRWLLANGLGHTAKSGMMKDKAPPAKTRVKKGETLWSISSRVYGDGSKWKDVAALNPHIRNPDVIFADDTIRMR